MRDVASTKPGIATRRSGRSGYAPSKLGNPYFSEQSRSLLINLHLPQRSLISNKHFLHFRLQILLSLSAKSAHITLLRSLSHCTSHIFLSLSQIHILFPSFFGHASLLMLVRMTLRSGSGQACAACKLQRRRCTSQCLLAPFFPADQPAVFHSVHRLFGVKHIQKLLKELHPDQRAMAMKSVKFHAAMRERNPVCGCLVEVQSLAYQIQVAEEELHAVLSQLQLGMAPPGNTSVALVHQEDQPQYNVVTTHASSCSTNINGDFYNKDCNDVDSLWMQQQTYSYSNNNNNNNSMVMQSQMTTSQPISIPQESVQDYNEMHSFFDNVDDRQSYIGPKEVYESSLESSVRDSRQSDEQMAENELKNAAACFSLTSFN